MYPGYRNIKVRIGDRQNKVGLDDEAMEGFKVFFNYVLADSVLVPAGHSTPIL